MSLAETIAKKYLALNKIHSVMLEITHRCPCSCIHCYLDDRSSIEMSLPELDSVFSQLEQEGALNICITGGDPFARKDLPEILKTAAEYKFLITILTTGILVGREEARMLHDTGVRNLELSIMGASAQTHDRIMNHKGAFDKLFKAIDHLKEQGMNITLKSTIMKLNYKELAMMNDLALKMGLVFSASIQVLPGIAGSDLPREMSLSVEEIATLDPSLLIGGLIPEEERKGAVFTCNAGKTICGISPAGDIYPCIVFRKKIGSLRENGLNEIWHGNPDSYLIMIREARPEMAVKCFSCDLKQYCMRCPGGAFLETGDYLGVPASSCTYAGGLKKSYSTKKGAE